MGKLKFLDNIKFSIAVLIIAFFISYFVTIQRDKTHNKLVEQDNRTIGIIIDQYTTGLDASQRVKFSYVINNKTYKKSVGYGRRFMSCGETRECIGRKFTVYYDIDNPENVFIDFDDEIGGGVR